MRWDIKSDGGPVCITAVDDLLVSSHGVHLDIGGIVADRGWSFPCDNILDVVAIKSSEGDDVTTKEGTVVPGNGIDVDSIVNSEENALRKNVENGGIFYASGSTIPSFGVNFICEISRQYFEAIGIISGWCMPAKVTCGKAITSVPKNRLWSHGSGCAIEMRGR